MSRRGGGEDDDGEDDRRFSPIDLDHEPAYWSRDEKRRVMKMVEQHEHARWLWNTIMLWAKWLSAVGAAVTVIKLGIYDTVRAWVGK